MNLRLDLPPLAALREEAASMGHPAANEVLSKALAAALGPLPARPAVYALRDAAGATLTIGHTADLRGRLLKVDGPVVAAAAVEYLPCGSAFEGALRQLAWLRTLEPERYGSSLPYPLPLYLKLDLRAKFPRFEPTDVPDVGPAIRLFGPYPTRKALEAAESALYGTLPLRRCTWDVQGHDVDESCIYLQMRRCAAPCTGDVSVQAYRWLVEAGADLLVGRPERAAAEVTARRDAAAAALAFEEAGRLQAALDRLARQQPPPAVEIARWSVAVLTPAFRPPRAPGEPQGLRFGAPAGAVAAAGFRAGRLVHEGRLEPAAGDLEEQAAALAAAIASAPEPPPGAAGTPTRARAEEAALLVAWLGRARPPASMVIDLDDPAAAVPALVEAAVAILAPRRVRRPLGRLESGGPGRDRCEPAGSTGR